MDVLTTCGYLFAVTVGALVSSTSIAAGSDSQHSPSQMGLRSIPIAHVKTTGTSERRYKFAFQNETGRPFRYMQGSAGRTSSANLRLYLSEGGKRLPSHAPTPEPVPFVQTRVQTLKLNESLEGELILAHYGRLKPGRYEIRAKYNVAKTHSAAMEFGMTPQQFERTVMILHVEK